MAFCTLSCREASSQRSLASSSPPEDRLGSRHVCLQWRACTDLCKTTCLHRLLAALLVAGPRGDFCPLQRHGHYTECYGRSFVRPEKHSLHLPPRNFLPRAVPVASPAAVPLRWELRKVRPSSKKACSTNKICSAPSDDKTRQVAQRSRPGPHRPLCDAIASPAHQRLRTHDLSEPQ